MSKSKILLLFTNHRVAEKLWPIIPLLSIEYEIDLFCVGLFSLNTPWVGDIDERLVAINKYNQYFNNVIQGPGIKFALAAHIQKYGIKPSLFFTKPFEKAFKKLPDVLIDKYGLDAETLLNSILNQNLKNIK